MIEDIILYMREQGLLTLPLLLTLAIAAKMKLKTYLTDIPFALTDAQTLRVASM
ncbi:MAG: hypothetical protein ACYCYO_17485 [Bacilli bacterium]